MYNIYGLRISDYDKLIIGKVNKVNISRTSISMKAFKITTTVPYLENGTGINLRNQVYGDWGIRNIVI